MTVQVSYSYPSVYLTRKQPEIVWGRGTRPSGRLTGAVRAARCSLSADPRAHVGWWVHLTRIGVRVIFTAEDS